MQMSWGRKDFGVSEVQNESGSCDWSGAEGEKQETRRARPVRPDVSGLVYFLHRGPWFHSCESVPLNVGTFYFIPLYLQ